MSKGKRTKEFEQEQGQQEPCKAGHELISPSGSIRVFVQEVDNRVIADFFDQNDQFMWTVVGSRDSIGKGFLQGCEEMARILDSPESSAA